MSHAPVLLAVFPPANGATNFARDDVLRDAARARGAELVRLYAWDRPVVSFGRNERAVGRFDPDRLDVEGLDVVRRPTGGRALFHHRELTYAVAGPVAPGDALRRTYDRLSVVLTKALSNLGIAAERAVPHAAQSLDGAPCFAVPSAGEIVVDGRKLIASAQWRDAGAFLQHGSILADNDQPRLSSGLADGQTLPPLPVPATLRELLGRVPSLDEFADALMDAYETCSGATTRRVAPEALAPDIDVRARIPFYLDPAWTWRR